MALLSWFSKKDPEDYEQVLSSLAADILKRQTRLSEIRLRERRTTLLVTFYALGFWIAYLGAWYAGVLPHVGNDGVGRALKSLPVFIGPILIQFIRRIVQAWYTRIGDAEEKKLKNLRVEQLKKVEEMKKKTNYYSTKTLLDRYDASPADSPLRLRPVQGMMQVPPATPQRVAFSDSNRPDGRGPSQVQAQTPQTSSSSTNPQVQVPMTPPRRQWYDKLADALLGDDELSASATASRYALICQRCFAHNGLVKEDMWEETQYICPKCGHFNPSPRTRHSTLTPQQNLQRPTGPRKSMPPSNVLLHPELAGNEPAIADRRKSMPALASSLSDDVQTRSSIPAHSPLSSVISLPEEDEEGATGDNSIITQTDADISVSVSESAERSTQMEVD